MMDTYAPVVGRISSLSYPRDPMPAEVYTNDVGIHLFAAVRPITQILPQHHVHAVELGNVDALQHVCLHGTLVEQPVDIAVPSLAIVVYRVAKDLIPVGGVRRAQIDRTVRNLGPVVANVRKVVVHERLEVRGVKRRIAGLLPELAAQVEPARRAGSGLR